VDTDYFAPVNISEGPSCLMLVARMKDPVPVAYALYFYDEVYPLILRENPDLKLYLVGRDPSKAILELSVDPLVHVTGYVKNVRPHLANVVISPDMFGTGIKNHI
jgi:hypothetical protein